MMSNSDQIEIIAHWGNRPEDRASCARRISAFMLRVLEGFHGSEWWFYDKKSIGFPDADIVSPYLRQNMSDVVPGKPIEQLGWSVSFHCAMPGYDMPFYMQVNCGAWSAGNVFQLRPRDAQCENFEFDQRVMTALVEAFDPDRACVYSSTARGRVVAAHDQAVEAGLAKKGDSIWPIVDWMVYIADARIPPEELPMVHSVEHIGTGTLVILKQERIHLDRPEDLALVEAVEPIIRRYQKPPLPSQTHHPKQDAKH